MKNRLMLVAIGGAFVLGFVIARQSSRNDVVVYSVPGPSGSISAVVHTDWPTYGLPLAEYLLIIKRLEESDTDSLKRQVDNLLDLAL